MTVRISRWFRFRVWLACKLLQIGSRFLPKDVVVANRVQPMTDEQRRQLQEEILRGGHTLQ